MTTDSNNSEWADAYEVALNELCDAAEAWSEFRWTSKPITDLSDRQKRLLDAAIAYAAASA